MSHPATARVFALALVIAAGLAAYANSLNVPLQFDDMSAIVFEPKVHASHLSLEELSRAAFGFPLRRWLARLSFGINHAIHGLRPFGYHVVNVAVHLVVASMVLVVTRKILERVGFGDEAGRTRAAAIAALLFAVHPVNTQAVTYVVQRMTSMGAAFALVAIWCWLSARERVGWPRFGFAAAAALSGALAAGCKESYVVLPVLVLALEWVLDPEFARTLRVRWRIWTAAAVLISGAGVLLAWNRWPDMQAEQARFGITLGQRALSQGRILVHYLSLIAWPYPGRFRVDYGYAASTGVFSPWTTAPALLSITGLVMAAVVLKRRAPLVSLAVAWFMVALLLEQTILPLDLVFEHRIYFAGMGFFMLGGAALERWVRVPAAGAWAVAAPLAALLTMVTVGRNAEWAEPSRLYAGEEGGGAGRVRNMLSRGAALAEQGRFDEAEQVFRRVVALAPGEVAAYVNLGTVELSRGRPAVAEEWYRVALRDGIRTEDHLSALYNLGIALVQQSRLQEAMATFESVVRTSPAHSHARVNLASLQLRAGDLEGAQRTVDEGLAIDSGFAPLLGMRARVLLQRGRGSEALPDAQNAVRLAPDDAGARVSLAAALLAARRRTEAHEAALEALRLAPGDPEARALVDATR